jgi:energy-coupling factor transporter ATP-binding protein EcfA2
MTILEQLIEWVKDKDTFVQNVLFRILSKNHLSEQDLIDLEELLIGIEYHQREEENIDEQKFQELIEDLDSQNDTILLSISENKNINALIDDSQLSFEKHGLNVIYGDNGSGKSSYVSILKHVCNTRGGYPQITKNLYKPENSVLNQEATVSHEQDSETKTVKWLNQEINNSDLKAVDVFDSKSANHYIENQAEIAFIPSDLAVIEKLGSSLKTIESRIKIRLEKLDHKRFDYNFLISEVSTENQKIIEDLSIDTDIALVRTYKKLNEDQIKELKSHEESLVKLKSQDPKKIIVENKRRAVRFNILNTKLKEIQLILGDESLNNLKILSTNLKAKKDVKEAAQKKSFSDLEFSNIGSDIWKELWLSARKFIEEGKGEFPDTKDGAKCPLCIQDLNQEAKDRFNNFEKYSKEKFEQEYIEARNALGIEYEKIKKLEFSFPDLVETEKELKKEIQNFDNAYTNYLRNTSVFIKALKKNIADPNKITTYDEQESDSPITLVTEHIASIEETNKTLEEKSIDTEIAKINTLIENLKAHKKLANHKPQLIKEVLRLRKIKALKKCVSKCSTRNVTLLSNRIAKEFVHDKIRDAFKDELSKLGFKNINVSLESKGERGKQYNYLSLSESYGSSTKLKEILSEGEHRCISIATFFSELCISDHNSAIVFDDPVTSLDHKWRNRIAKRIVIESQKRQVILFTHDITFLMLLQEHSEKLNSDCFVKSLTRKKTETGIVRENPPWDAMSVTKRIGILNTQVQNLVNIDKKEPEDTYKAATKLFYGKLRETWERFIEEDFLNGTIKRFGREIHTKSLKKVVKLKEEDYQIVDVNMSKCSTYFTGHDTSGVLIEETPNIDEVKEDLENLVKFRKDIIKRK